MKKLLCILAVVLVCASFCSCTNKGDTTPTAEPTTTHTLPPTENTTTEYEWAEIDCELALTDKDGNTVAYADDFETFAIVGSTDDDSYIIVKLTDEATDIINTTSDVSELSLSINGEVYSDVTFPDEFTGEIEIGNNMTFEQVCELATTIRGLFN